MPHNSNDELPSPNDIENDIAEFELDISSSDFENPKQSNKRNFLAKKKIEQLQEERRLRKLDADYYDDWD